MNKMQLEILKSALDLKEASIKRAINTNKNPRFQPVYDLELQETNAVKIWLAQQKPDDK